MIIGIGTDVVDIRRIERTIARFGQRFVERCFAPSERDAARGRADSVAFLAKRFAAKEAVWKALGEGPRLGIAWHELRVERETSGKPTLRLDGEAGRRLRELTPPGMVPRLDLSLTDEPPMAVAFVVISAEQDGLRPIPAGEAR